MQSWDRMLTHIRAIFYDQILKIVRYRTWLGIVFSAFITFFYCRGIIVSPMTVIPEVATFASVLLAIIGLGFSVLTTIQDSKLYLDLKSKFPEMLKELAALLESGVLWSIAVVLICLGMQVIDFGEEMVGRYTTAFVAIYFFWMMCTTTIGSFLITFQLFKGSIGTNS